VKLLSPKQDNEKNRIHLGSGLDGITNLFPAQIEVRSASESLTKRNSAAGKTKLAAQIDFAWLGGNGARYDAPSSRIINYFQYPEVRMLGYLVVASGRVFTLSHGLHPPSSSRPLASSSKDLPDPSSTAARPVQACQRRIATST
jgi:hypothetical protein